MMVTLSFSQKDYHFYSFNFVSKTSQISLKKMVDPVLESSLETETADIIKNTHFDNYHPKKESWKNVFKKKLNIFYKY